MNFYKTNKSLVIRCILLPLILILMSMCNYMQIKMIKGDVITIEATGQCNNSASGTEIWIEAVNVDGKNFPAENCISKNSWSIEDGRCGWREYDGVHKERSINITIPYGRKRYVIFEQNIWRGICKIIYDGKSTEIDTYSDGENQLYYELPSSGKSNNYFVINSIWILLGGGLILDIVSIKQIFLRKRFFKKKINAEREVWADLLRVLCIFIVVLLHATCNIYETSYHTSAWIPVMCMNCLTACAVPTFFMLSGAFSIKKDISKKKILYSVGKLLFPLLSWSIIYIYIKCFYLNENINILNSIMKIGVQEQYPHLWFIYTLIGLYLLNPLLCKIYYSDLKKYFVLIFGVAPLVLTSIGELTNYKINIPFLYVFWPVAIIYFCGKMLEESNWVMHVKGWKYVGAFFVGLILLISMTYIGSEISGSATKRFFSGADNFAITMMYVSLYCCFLKTRKNIQKISPKIKRIISFCGECSIYIYFCHMMIFIFLEGKTVAGFRLTSKSDNLIVNLITGVVCFILSVLVAFIIKLIEAEIDKRKMVYE